MNDFGTELRRQRTARRLSQTVVSGLAGLDHSFVGRLEAGTREPSRATVEALAAALNASQAQRDALLASAGYLPSDEWIIRRGLALARQERVA